jgi:putative glutamine amidotransferase
MAELQRAERDGAAGPAPRPVIGVSGWVHEARWRALEALTTLVEHRFVRKLRECGASVVVVPPPPEDAAVIAARLDGLVLSGGEDVDPEFYGGTPSTPTIPGPRERDLGDLALTREMLRRDRPVLAICRGCQVLNVACGGTLVQHLPHVSDQRHQPRRDEPDWPFARHLVTAESPLVSDLLGERFEVPSSHHQAVDGLGAGLAPAARAEDGTIEAIWDPSKRFVLGVQWHPEVEEGNELFRGVVDAAAVRLAAADPSSSSAPG